MQSPTGSRRGLCSNDPPNPARQTPSDGISDHIPLPDPLRSRLTAAVIAGRTQWPRLGRRNSSRRGRPQRKRTLLKRLRRSPRNVEKTHGRLFVGRRSSHSTLSPRSRLIGRLIDIRNRGRETARDGRDDVAATIGFTVPLILLGGFPGEEGGEVGLDIPPDLDDFREVRGWGKKEGKRQEFEALFETADGRLGGREFGVGEAAGEVCGAPGDVVIIGVAGIRILGWGWGL